MAGDTVTLALNGDVPLHLFAESLKRFRELLDALTAEVAEPGAVDWVIDDLQTGSAITTVRGVAQSPDRVDRVIRAYGEIGRALERGQPIPFSPRVITPLQALTALVNGRITSIRLETAESDTLITEPLPEASPTPGLALPPAPSAWGAVEGRIQTLSNRKSLRFTLYDSLHDKAVACYLDSGQEAKLRDLWGHRAIVEGWVSRDPESGRPNTVRRIRDVIKIDEVPPRSYRSARGLLPVPQGGLPAEDAIRRIRDA